MFNNYYNFLLKYKKYFFIFFLFILFSIINTYPLIKNITKMQIGDGSDGVEGMWNLWQTGQSLKDFDNPYETDNIFALTGIDLYLHSLSPLNGLISMFFNIFSDGNFILNYNMIILLNLTLSGFCMFILSRLFIENNYISIICGYIYAFNPYIKGHLLGHMNLLTTWIIPMYIIFFIRFYKYKSYKYIFLCALFLILAHLSDYYYLYMLFIFSFLFVIYNFIKDKFEFEYKYFIRLISIFIIYFTVMLYFIYGIIDSKLSGKYADNWNADFWSPDVFTFIIPGPQFNISNIFKDNLIINNIWNNSHIGAENQNFLGYTLIFICIIGLFYIIKNKKKDLFNRIKFWIFLFIIMVIFVCGTQLKYFGNIYDISLPYYYIYDLLPLLSNSGRFMILVFLSLSLIFGVVLEFIIRNLPSIKKNIFLSLIVIVIFIEYMWIPFPLIAYNVSPFYDYLSKEEGDYIVYDLTKKESWGYIRSSGMHMYYQTIHNKKIIDGRISRNNIDLIKMVNGINNNIKYEQFKLYNIKYIIVDKDSKINFYFHRFYEDDNIVVYKVY